MADRRSALRRRADLGSSGIEPELRTVGHGSRWSPAPGLRAGKVWHIVVAADWYDPRVVDRPVVYVVREQSGAVIFAGQVLDPCYHRQLTLKAKKVSG